MALNTAAARTRHNERWENVYYDPLVGANLRGARDHIVALQGGHRLSDPLGNGLGRHYYLPRLAQLTVNGVGDGTPPPAQGVPLRIDTLGVDALPAIWLQQTEARIFPGVPNSLENRIAFNSTTGPLIARGLTDIVDGVQLSLRQFDPGAVGDMTIGSMSPSFREVFFEGVDVRRVGILRNLPQRFEIRRGEGMNAKWWVMTIDATMQTQMRQYMRLVLNRYLTEEVTPTSQFLEQFAIGPGAMVNIKHTSSSAFRYIPSLRRVTGYWSDKFRAGGNIIQTNRDLSVIRSAMVLVQVVNTPIDWFQLMNRIYPRVRLTSLFSANDVALCYYVNVNIYVEQVQAQQFQIPAHIMCHWMREHQGPILQRCIIDHVNSCLTKALQSSTNQQNWMHYDMWLEFTWVKDLALIQLYQQEQAIAPVSSQQPNRLRGGSRPPRSRRRIEAPNASVQSLATTPTTTRTRDRLGLRAGAHTGETHQEKMFVKGSMMRRFATEKSLFLCPDRPHQTCLIMSLFRAERTVYRFEGRGLTSVEKGPLSFTLSDNEFLLPVLDEEKWRSTRRRLPFYCEVEGQSFLRLSVSGKYESSQAEGKYLLGSFDEEEELFWEYAAEEMVTFMEWKLERDVDINDMDDTCQAFADTFELCVNVYDIECRGARVKVYTPEEKTIPQLLHPSETREIQLVSIVFDSNHCHPISHLQSFLMSQHRTKALGVYQYCPICDKRTSSELNTIDKAKKHISTCAATEKRFISRADAAFETNLKTAPTEIKPVFKRGEAVTYECATCRQKVTQQTYLKHRCILPRKKEMKTFDNNLIYVYDLESAQVPTTKGLLEHQCNCVVVQAVYGEENEWTHYENEVSFVSALVDPQSPYKGGVFLAHNGGGYDCQFLLRILERWDIEHSFTPSPGSQHKFLEITLKENKIRFLDFMRFVPGSLRSIAQAFGCELSKGDFPHKFNNGLRMNYVGALPPHEPDGDDFWCQKHTKNRKAANEFNQWYTNEASVQYCTCWTELSMGGTCVCNKIPWKFREELVRYCVLDVQVLSKVVKAYREEILALGSSQDESAMQDSTVHWKPVDLDPFSCMTLAQICIQMLAKGFQYPERHEVVTLHQRQRGGMNPKAIAWLEQRSRELEIDIVHRGNHTREYFHFRGEFHIDGYAEALDQAFVFLDCSYWGCPDCCPGEWEEAIHPERLVPYGHLAGYYHLFMEQLRKEFTLVEVMWEHDFTPTWETLVPYERECCQLFQYEEAFYGGRTEVFSLYADANVRGEEIEYHDVTSLYPSVYLAVLPTGTPRHLLGPEIDRERLHPTASNRYFGFVKAHVTPRSSDCIGLLPCRSKDTDRLLFPVSPMLGCWGTEELYLAMQHGYILDEVYELYHWEPEERSDQYLRGYVGAFLRMKQESEGWKKLGASSETPSEQERQEIAERLFHQNGGLGRIRPHKVAPNPVKRQLAKLFLNSLWGKFAQKEGKFETMTVYGPAQFAYLWSHASIRRETFTFRETSTGVYKVRFEWKDSFVKHVPHGNILFAARVTEAARCVLHTRMFKIGPERILYCDTDSLIFFKDPQGPELLGVGLGHWTNEYPDKRIVRFAALAPKMYMLQFEDAEESVRAKGVQLSLRNKEKLKLAKIMKLLLPVVRGAMEQSSVWVDNFSIFTNAQLTAFQYATMLTRENQKEVRVVISKRKVVVDPLFEEGLSCRICTLPWGYEKPPHG